MIKKVSLGLSVVILVVIAVTATRPDSFHIERSASISAPSERVHGLINDFHQWERWSPWEKLDPAMTKTYSGADKGVGASYAWSGNDEVGEGKQSITASAPEAIVLDLHFMRPIEARNTTTFRFQPEANGTRVTWSMDGRNNFVGKFFSLFMDMDKMVGPDFERGLSNLKSVAEAP
jgi:hypothetical protein